MGRMHVLGADAEMDSVLVLRVWKTMSDLCSLYEHKTKSYGSSRSTTSCEQLKRSIGAVAQSEQFCAYALWARAARTARK